MRTRKAVAQQLHLLADMLEDEEVAVVGAQAAVSPAVPEIEPGINVAAAAKLLAVSEDHIYGLVEAGKIPCYRVPSVKGEGGRELIRFVPSLLVAWRKENSSMMTVRQ